MGVGCLCRRADLRFLSERGECIFFEATHMVRFSRFLLKFSIQSKFLTPTMSLPSSTYTYKDTYLWIRYLCNEGIKYKLIISLNSLQPRPCVLGLFHKKVLRGLHYLMFAEEVFDIIVKITEATITPCLALLLTAKKESCGGLLFSHASPRAPPIAPDKLPVPSAVGEARNMGAFGSEDDLLRGKDSVNVLDDALRRWCASSVG